MSIRVDDVMGMDEDLLPEGVYTFRCFSASQKKSKNEKGTLSILLGLEVTESEVLLNEGTQFECSAEGETVWHNVWIPMEGEDPKKAANKISMVKQAIRAFDLQDEIMGKDLTFDSPEFSELFVNRSCRGKLKIERSEQYGDKNAVARLFPE